MRRHYAWVICLMGLLMAFFASGMVTSTLSLFLPVFRETLKITNTQTSLMTTIRCVSSMAATLIAVRIYRKMTLKGGIIFAHLLAICGWLVFAAANAVSSLLLCYAGCILIGLAYGWGGTLPISILINNWFTDRKATALGIATCGSSLCTAIASPLVTRLSDDIGVSKTFLFVAGAFVCCVAVFVLLLKSKPADMGLEQYSEGQAVKKETERKLPEVLEMTKAKFAGLVIPTFLVGFAGASYMSFIVIHFVTEGYSRPQAAAAFSGVGLVMMIGKLSFGMISDRFGTFKSNFLFLGVWILASFTIMSVDGHSIWIMYLSAILSGFGITIGTLGVTMWANDLSPKSHYALNMQHNQTAFTLGSLIGSPFPGIIADITGSYAAVFMIYGFIFIIVTIIIQSQYIHLMRYME